MYILVLNLISNNLIKEEKPRLGFPHNNNDGSVIKMRYHCRENGVLGGEKKTELLRDLNLEIIKRQVIYREHRTGKQKTL